MYRVLLTAVIAAATCTAIAQPPSARPPAKVTTARVEQGMLKPTADFEGTVYFKEVSNLATETSGKVEQVNFEEGQHIDAGTVLVRLDYALLEEELQAAEATYRRNEALLKQEQARFERAKELLEDEVTTPQQYDDLRFTVESLQHAMAASRAQSERIRREIEKKTIQAPFDGVVVERQVELGEWKREGDSIAVFARDDEFDVMVNLPERFLPFISPGATLDMRISDRPIQGGVVAVIPRGDIATNTFPVKVRVAAVDWLLEGMSATVQMPTGNETESLLIPRDAIVLLGGKNYVFAVREGKASQVPVEVQGYKGLTAGIAAPDLQPGDEVATKGHERLQPGQDIQVVAANQVQ
ncbi:MAG: efflux RND transporter periplasmic adaptor subunit [Candidatus Hydrogenedentes bacterium]|nr:efflux RND transporter periplasmic adaptor subunit [Candidatus Hydrogenedentota bacterium]